MDSPWKTLLGKANAHDWPNIHQPFPVHAPGEYRLTFLIGNFSYWNMLAVRRAYLTIRVCGVPQVSTSAPFSPRSTVSEMK